ncbi:MAG: hypothetical protein QHG99_02975 [Methanomicrobiales archaeon]|nr:hypothetical protein [Methanomicrobiales archaeon]
MIQFKVEPNRISPIYYENPMYGKPFTNAYLYHFYKNSLISTFIMSFEENDAKMIAMLDNLESCGMGIVEGGTEVKNCTDECTSKAPHLVWDRESEYPECSCIYEKGYEIQDLGTTVRCIACTDICRQKDPYSVYNEEDSAPNACECVCERGFEPAGSGLCKKVKCPSNATNTADMTVSCPQGRIISRNCCCDEGFLLYNGECAAAGSAESDYFIQPVTAEIAIGETAQFSVVEKKLGRYNPLGNDRIRWSIAQAKSVNPYLQTAEIGTIDGSGHFAAKSAGTCTVIATLRDQIKLKADVTVRCPDEKKGDLNQIFRLYMARIPTGPIIRDLAAKNVS